MEQNLYVRLAGHVGLGILSLMDTVLHALLVIELIRSLFSAGFSDHTLLVAIATAAWSISMNYASQVFEKELA